ncbi:YkgB family protein [Candidatus Nitrospira neomarina]|uniref:DUF417 family protein n=1 Tax=Candidatus Nitrospira neomarina TaxID=3020899 RepID=A0AA96JY55_9BACT|nr:DUF417 family protein [Candidatus Nitrospira neomarina]WNM64138.1 DUF417 family protein [Candidatus Nitrospira neomarina]
MATITATTSLTHKVDIGQTITRMGIFLTRLGLVIVFLWIGAMKFTAYEAQAIQPLVANSPFMSWLYGLFSIQAFSNGLGVLEITIGLMIAAREISPLVSAIGSAFGAVLFLGTLSFMVSTPPVWEATLGGFPALSVAPGQFLLKDLALLGAAIWICGESLEAMKNRFA